MSITVILALFRGSLGARVYSQPPEKSIYYIFYILIRYENLKIPKQNCIPLLGVAPRDPRVWPLGGLGVHEKGPRYT